MPKLAKYDPSAMEAALREMHSEGISLRLIARKYGVPRTSLQFKSKNPGYKNSCGPSPVLSKEEESTLVRWIIDMARKGFPRKREDIISSVQEFLITHPRPNLFKENRPGEGWLKAFFRRHPVIVERTSEPVTSASSCVSETDIRKWFIEVEAYVKEKKLEEAMADPSRVFNGDETGFQICPSTGRVLAAKGAKNVYDIEKSSSKENITVMFSFSADGKLFCPMIVYPYKRIPEKISDSVPADWGIARSDSGWMTAEVFFEYICNVFHPYLMKQGVQFPVVLFVDGHKSHLTYQVSVLCTELQIEIIALYPNATRILQPADVSVFRPIKMLWRKAVREWQSMHPGEILNKVSFAPLLKEVIEKSAKPETLTGGFRACGLYPFNVNALDYSKCLGTSSSQNSKKSDEHVVDSVMSYSTFVNIVGKEKIEEIAKTKELLTDKTEECFTLFRIWEYFKKGNSETENSSVNVMHHEDNPSACNGSYSDGNRTTNKSERVSNGCSARLESTSSMDLAYRENNDSEGSMSVCVREVIMSSGTSPVARVSGTNKMSEFLTWPETPKRKGKRQGERQPFAITSSKYREMFEKKKLAKIAEAEKKEARKRKRMEAQEERKNNHKIKANRRNPIKKGVKNLKGRCFKENITDASEEENDDEINELLALANKK